MLKVIKYSAVWCGPCRALAPVFKKVKEANPDVTFQDIDLDQENPHNVRSIPTVIFVVDGVEKERIVGARSPEVYQTKINSFK